MAVYAAPGRLYLAPTAVTGTNGTLLSGIEEQSLVFATPTDLLVTRAGIRANDGYRVRNRQAFGPALLSIPLRAHDAAALAILFAHITTTGEALRTDARGGFELMPTFAAVVRPLSAAEKYIYAPAWRLAPDSEWALEAHSLRSPVSGVLNLIAGDAGGALPPYLRASAAAIATAYTIPEAPA
jgi:hypothetical protein